MTVSTPHAGAAGATHSKLSMDDGTSGAFVEFAKYVKVIAPAIKQNEQKLWFMDTTDDFPVKLATTKEVENLKIEVFHNYTNYSRMYAALGVSHSFKFEGLTDAGGSPVYTYTGFIATIGEVSAEREKDMMFTVEISVSGAPTIA